MGMQQHDMAGRLWIVRDRSRPIKADPNQVCHHCGAPHEYKTYHLQFDQDSTVIVSHGIWNRLQTLFDNGGLEAVNDVAKPPTQTIVVPSAQAHVTSRMSELAKEARHGTGRADR